MSWNIIHCSRIGRALVYTGCILILAQAFMLAGPGIKHAYGLVDVTGCVPPETMDYTGFEQGHFETMENISITNGNLVLDTGQQAVDPNRIIIPFTQEVFVYFIFEGAGYKSDMGWMLRSEAEAADTNHDGEISDSEFAAIPSSQKRILFRAIQDDMERPGCCSGGDGVLDIFYPTYNWTESQIANYDDGTDYHFVPNYDGVVDIRDMRKSLGVIAGGTEIVFFIKANQSNTNVYWNVVNFNEDPYTNARGYGFGTRTFNLWQPNEGWHGFTSGWMSQVAIDNLQYYFGITVKDGDTMSYELEMNQKPPHLIAAVPQEDPYAWILTWEDLPFNASNDLDSNDNVFFFQRRTGGTAQSVAIDSIPAGNTDTTITAVNIRVVELLPCEDCEGKTRIQWYLSIDGGVTWEEVSIWDQVIEPETCDVAGTPPKRRITRSARVDFAAMNKVGNDLKWKGILQSEDDDCVPEVEDVDITYQATRNALFSRSSPIVLANVLYTGAYETPAPEWIAEGGLRGHVHAVRLYDPTDPNNADASDVQDIWDAGEWLRDNTPDSRKIKISDITLIDVVAEPLQDEHGVVYQGDDYTTQFVGTLEHGKIQAGTLTITDGSERFTTSGPSTLEGDKGGTGTYNRFTGEYDITFHNPPVYGVSITATYRYYYYTQELHEFDTSSATSEKLGLDDSRYIDDTGEHYNWDLDGDGDFDNGDREVLIKWVRGWRRSDPVASGYMADDYNASNKWKLGPIDHSAPAIIGPPGEPEWFNGSGISEQERVEFVTWRNSPGIADRHTMLYVGARDGMLHAFYAGQFRHGDNKQMADPSDPCLSQMPSELANIEEFRGYFKWDPAAGCSPNYGTGEERWAFIPNNILSRLKNNFKSTGDQGYVDASPAVADVKIGDEWRTVLVCAEGNGGDTIFALDVTNPYDVANVKFLWEFSDPDIYRSKSSPAIGRVWVNGQEKWVAFFSSGKSKDPTQFGSIFLVDVVTGNLIKRVYLDAAGEPARGNSPSGTASIADGDRNGFIDRFYVGDDKGYMYRVNLFPSRSDNPENWTDCILANVEQPIYASPSILVNNETDVEVFFGTGDDPSLDDSDASTQYVFWALHDKGNNNQCITKFGSKQDGIALAASSSEVWYYELPAGHRVWASAFAAASRVYFATTTTETEDPCAISAVSGGGSVFAMERSSGSVAMSMQVGNVFSSPIVEDEHLYIKPANPEGWPNKKGVTLIGDTQFNNPMRGGQRVSIKSWREIVP